MDNNNRRFQIREHTNDSHEGFYDEILETPAGAQQLTITTATATSVSAQSLSQQEYQYLNGTPASHIAAAAVGRRLELGATARPPQFALHQPPSGFNNNTVDEGALEDSVFTTPVMNYHQRAERGRAADGEHSQLMSTGPSDLRSYWDQRPSEAAGNKQLPSLSSFEHQFEEHAGFWNDSIDISQEHDNSFAQQIADGPPTPFENQNSAEIDEDFMLNLNQEGDLERLTRKAMNDASGAWKKLTMDILRKQLDSLDEDEWMYISDCR
ncbi:hypothetical protein COEREDRAFT_83415 [Coemansia reversa NRRL 1564]|uniref:Uncharacterized protein n=1 Tax=Coemansia reversa (strain ATCC 12441 / NRRL 1564) TaxID=763665 RepID=A0A2G5B497_COERN|nr:hypothetical protein COEREDRAFT_83415 [Coemansia reversa NRRL 1564]|eukprot:PIA13557.1 hypothetical protein COEREDRAFT_83415 [Coemansia reversa NRRL 1564]